MKIKTDFVTNSSSSSYIIAVKKGLTVEDIKNELLKNKEDLKSYLDEYKEYWGGYYNEGDEYDIDNPEARILKAKTEKQKIDFLAEALAREIVNEEILENALEIGDYLAYAREGSSEDIELFSNWLYSFADINNDNLKIGGYS